MDITFLYRLTDGPVDKSYGMHVAKRAGLSSELVRHAAAKSRELELTQQKAFARNLVRCLHPGQPARHAGLTGPTTDLAGGPGLRAGKPDVKRPCGGLPRTGRIAAVSLRTRAGEVHRRHTVSIVITGKVAICLGLGWQAAHDRRVLGILRLYSHFPWPSSA
jgi:hypothetical protein